MLFQCQNCKNLNDVEMDLAGSVLNCGVCGGHMKVPRTRPASGWVYNDDVVLSGLVGTGGMSMVFKAYRISQDDEIAIKILDSDVSQQGGVPQLFMQEARMSTLLSHPNIVKAYSFGVDRGSLYYVMEFIKGQTLEEIIEEHGPLSEKESSSVLLRVTEALQYAWRDSELLHRDVKPGNIMLNTDSEIKLMDLGLASCNRFDIDRSLMRGTYQYLCPEHILKMDMNEKSDIYSLGATLYYLLTGKFIFDDTVKRGVEFLDAHVNKAPRPIRRLLPNMSVKLERLIMAMLDKSPDYRPTYQEVMSALKDTSRVMAHVSNPKQLPPRKNMYNTVVGLPLTSTATKAWANQGEVAPSPMPFRPQAGPAPSVSTNFSQSSSGTARVKPSAGPGSFNASMGTQQPGGSDTSHLRIKNSEQATQQAALNFKSAPSEASGAYNAPSATGGFNVNRPPNSGAATGGFNVPSASATGGFNVPQASATGGFNMPSNAASTGAFRVGGPAVAPNAASTGGFKEPSTAGSTSSLRIAHPSATNQFNVNPEAPNLAGISGSPSASAGTLRIKAEPAAQFPQTAAPLDGESGGTLRVLANDLAKRRDVGSTVNEVVQAEEIEEPIEKPSKKRKSSANKSKSTRAQPRVQDEKGAKKRGKKNVTETELDLEVPEIKKTESTIIVQDVSRKKTITIVVLNVILVALVVYYFVAV